MDLILYGMLSTRSRRAINRKYGRWGHVYKYLPRETLLANLAKETGWSKESVRQQLYRERAFLLELQK